MRFLDFKQVNIEKLKELFIDYSEEIELPLNYEEVTDYFNHIERKISEGVPLSFKVVVLDEKIIGFIFFNTKFNYRNYNNSYVLELYVINEYRYLGIGKALLENAEKEAVKSGSLIMYLTPNKKVLLFYDKCGYTPTGMIYEDNGLEIYQKTLNEKLLS